jgi:histone acetyltransferase MYST1
LELEALEEERMQLTQVRNIDTIFFDQYKMDTWYFSPFPDEYKNEPVLYLCEWCLKYSKSNESLMKHKASIPYIV